MKRALCLILSMIMILALFSGCRRNNDDETEPVSESETAPVTEQATEDEPALKLPETYAQSIEEGFTEIAAMMGITLENYPIIDGTVDMHSVSVALADIFLTDKIKGSPILNPYPDENSSVDDAYNYLTRGEVEIIFAPQPSDSQKTKIENSGKELTYIPLGYKVFVFASSPSSSLDEISLKEIESAYKSGSKDFEVYSESGTDTPFSQYFLKTFMGKDAFSSSVKMTDDIVNALKTADGDAIGYTDLETARRNGLKVLSLDKVEPSRENAESGKYQYKVDYYAVIRKDAANVEVLTKLAEFLRTDAGRVLLENCGLYIER